MKQKELLLALIKSITIRQWILIACYLLYAYVVLDHSVCYILKCDASAKYITREFVT